MKTTKLAILTLAMLPGIRMAIAQDAQPPGPPKEMSLLKSYEGSWTCRGGAPSRSQSPIEEWKEYIGSEVKGRCVRRFASVIDRPMAWSMSKYRYSPSRPQMSVSPRVAARRRYSP